MSKGTYLKELCEAHKIESNAKYRKTQSVYKNMDKSRWVEVCEAYNRKVIRKQRHKVGKSNKYGCRKTPLGMIRYLNYIGALAQICRNNWALVVRNGSIERGNHE